MNTHAKIFNKILANNPATYKKNYIQRPSGIYPKKARLVKHSKIN